MPECLNLLKKHSTQRVNHMPTEFHCPGFGERSRPVEAIRARHKDKR